MTDTLTPRALPSGRKKSRDKIRIKMIIIFPANRSFMHFIGFKVKGSEPFEN